MKDDKEYISKEAFITQQRKQYCENCERRKGTKNGKRIFVYEIGETPCRACDIEDMIDAVDGFLPADVALVVHGHWVKVENARNVFKCSRCGHIRELRHIFEIISKPKLCEECGAKMDMGGEDE